MIHFIEVVWLTIVGMLWGCTNPLLKQGSSGVAGEDSSTNDNTTEAESPSGEEEEEGGGRGEKTKKVEKKNIIKTALKDILFLLSRWRYVVPFLVNQLGSVVFFWRLSGSDMSLVSPVANGLAFFFTAVTEMIFFNGKVTARAVLGSTLVVLGVTLCTLAKTQ